MYAGTQHGLYRLNGQQWEELKTDQPVFQVTEVVADRHNRVWMIEVTYSKIFMYDGKRFHEMKGQTPIANDRVENLRLDADGKIRVDIPPAPATKSPQRTFQWDATVEGKVGPPVEVH